MSLTLFGNSYCNNHITSVILGLNLSDDFLQK